MKSLLACLLAVLMALAGTLAQGADNTDAVVLIGHSTVPRIDLATAQRLYLGRTVEIGGMPVTVVNLAPSNRLRERFMSTVMNQDDDKYIAYWTVRKHIGKGTPPRELRTAGEVIEYVQSTPGAVGYIAAADLRPAMNVVLRP